MTINQSEDYNPPIISSIKILALSERFLANNVNSVLMMLESAHCRKEEAVFDLDYVNSTSVRWLQLRCASWDRVVKSTGFCLTHADSIIHMRDFVMYGDPFMFQILTYFWPLISRSNDSGRKPEKKKTNLTFKNCSIIQLLVFYWWVFSPSIFSIYGLWICFFLGAFPNNSIVKDTFLIIQI